MSALHSKILRPHELDSRDIAIWRQLQRQVPHLGTPFLSHAFAVAASRVFGNVFVSKLQRAGRTIGFFTFQYRSALHRALGIGERLGGELSDYFGLVAEQELSLSAAELLRLSGLNTLYFTHLDENQQNFGLSGEQPEPGLKIEFPNGGPAFWTARRQMDKKFTADTERRERKLVQAHGPLDFVFRHEQPAIALAALIEAKRAQYHRTGVHDSLSSARGRKFLAELAQCDDPDCRATLSTLHAGKQWVGSHFGLMFGETLHYWFPVYNPEMKSYAPGRLVIKAIIDAAGENGVRMIDRGSGDSVAKQDFATARHHFLRGVWMRPGPIGLLYRARLSAGWRLRNINTVAGRIRKPEEQT